MKSRFSFTSKDARTLGDDMINHYISLTQINRLVELVKEPSYRMPRGLTREERRMYMKFVASVLDGL